MGHVREKYTETYFTRRHPDGSPAQFGAEGYDAFLLGQIRDQDLLILNQVEFTGKRVLEFGFGRGEAIKFALEHGARHYEGVDFSPAARAIAASFLSGHGISSAVLHTADALDFLKAHVADSGDTDCSFDVVLMLDFVEHVPRHELRELLTLLPAVLAPACLVAVNTPAYRYDNDVIADGLDARNHEDAFDTADFRAETSGMHCNKYSVVSLQAFMHDCGYRNISESHFFVPEVDQDLRSPRRSYRVEWERAHDERCPIVATYVDDTIEHASETTHSPVWQHFDEGQLEGIEILATDEYRLSVFPGGEYDHELFDDSKALDLRGKLVFDVGGFMGVSSLLFSRMVGPGGRVLVFEPNPWNAIRMQRNFSANHDLGRRIEIYGLALGDSPGASKWTFSASIDDGRSSTSRLGSAHATISTADLRRFGFSDDVVRVTTLDSFVEECRVVPDVIKVDIEGAEHLLLLGGSRTLMEYNPTLYIEIHSPFCGLMCANVLRDLGYVMRPLVEETDGRVMVKAHKARKRLTEIAEYSAWLTLPMAAPMGETETLLEENRLLRDELTETQHQLGAALRVVNHPSVRVLRSLSSAGKRVLRRT